MASYDVLHVKCPVCNTDLCKSPLTRMAVPI